LKYSLKKESEFHYEITCVGRKGKKKEYNDEYSSKEIKRLWQMGKVLIFPVMK
jgi:hypothetical protein